MADDTITLKVNGMSCQHCVKTVHDALASLPGVAKVDVSLNPGKAVIAGTGLDAAALKAVIEDLGYEIG